MRRLGITLIAAAAALLIGLAVYLFVIAPSDGSVVTADPTAGPGPVATSDAEPGPASSQPAASPEPQPAQIAFSDLQLGTCLTDAHLTGGGGAVHGLQSIGCASAHYEEVIHLGTYTHAAYPGHEALVDELDVACVAAFADYVGVQYASSTLLLDYLLPTETSWNAGDRGYACLVYGQEALVGSVKGSAQ